MAEKELAQESKRDRVRRLLIDPLKRDGMRYKADVSKEDQRKRLDQMADDVAHMSDQNLIRLFLCLRTKGEGSSKCFWPSRVTVLAYAEVAQPRPLADDPRLRSWFASQAGRAAASVPGRLLAEFEFWTSHKHPPFSPAHQRLIAPRADEIARRADRISEREGRGAMVNSDDAAWMDRYRVTLSMLQGWINESGQAA